MQELIDLNDKVRMLHEVTKMVKDSNFKSDEVKYFNAGAEFAYKNVLKLIYDYVKEENERKETK